MQDLFSVARSSSFPRGIRFLLIGVIVLAVASNIILFAISWAQDNSVVVSATIQFFATVLPLILVFMVFSYLGTSMKDLKSKTQDFLLQEFPTLIQSLPERVVEPYLSSRKLSVPERKSGVIVYTNFVEEDCYADFFMFFNHPINAQEKVVFLPLRLELNVYRITVNICFLDVHLQSIGLESGQLFEKLTHSLGGAKKTAEIKKSDGNAHSSAYEFVPVPLRRERYGHQYHCLVGYKSLAEDFLWDSKDKLHFVQDLVFMLRSCLHEAPELFLTLDSPLDEVTMDSVHSLIQAE
jgi:hypothetical protein